MARSRETKIELTAYDDLFQTDESRAESTLEKIQIVPASEVFPYARQPYSTTRVTKDLIRLMDSIGRSGIQDPLIVRPRDKGGYEIISGHSLELGMLQVKPIYHHQGIGKFVLSTVESLAKEKGLKRVIIHTTEDNHIAQMLYSSCGYLLMEIGPCTTADGQKRVGYTYQKVLT